MTEDGVSASCQPGELETRSGANSISVDTDPYIQLQTGTTHRNQPRQGVSKVRTKNIFLRSNNIRQLPDNAIV